MYEKNKKNKLYKQNKIDETESSTYRNQERYREREYEEKKWQIESDGERESERKKSGYLQRKHLREITRNVHSIRDRNNYLKQVSPTKKKHALATPKSHLLWHIYEKNKNTLVVLTQI